MAFTKAVDETLVPGAVREQSKIDGDLSPVRRVQAGDVAAFDQLILKYRERLYSIIYNLCSNREDAADLTQETFIKAFSSIKRFKGKSSFYTWLYRIAVNSTLSYLKRNRMRHFFSFETINEEVSSSEIVEALSIKVKSEKTALMNELQEKLNEALQKLSDKHRTVVVLYEIEGLSHHDISNVMECSVGTVRSRLHYAKQQLQAYLKDYLD